MTERAEHPGIKALRQRLKNILRTLPPDWGTLDQPTYYTTKATAAIADEVLDLLDALSPTVLPKTVEDVRERRDGQAAYIQKHLFFDVAIRTGERDAFTWVLGEEVPDGTAT